MSHVSRAKTELPVTLASLNRVGFYPQVTVSDGTPSSRENRAVFLRALRAGIVDDVLFFEDDVIADGALPGWVEAARSQPDPVTFCLIRPANHSQSIKRLLRTNVRIPRQLLPVENILKWYGTQAIYLPKRLVEAIVNDPDFFAPHMFKGKVQWTGADIWLRENIPRLGFTLRVAFPNPVQHRDAPKLVQKPGRDPNKPRVSLTYGR